MRYEFFFIGATRATADGRSFQELRSHIEACKNKRNWYVRDKRTQKVYTCEESLKLLAQITTKTVLAEINAKL